MGKREGEWIRRRGGGKGRGKKGEGKKRKMKGQFRHFTTSIH
jgi:hypothetical protein